MLTYFFESPLSITFPGERHYNIVFVNPVYLLWIFLMPMPGVLSASHGMLPSVASGPAAHAPAQAWGCKGFLGEPSGTRPLSARVCRRQAFAVTQRPRPATAGFSVCLCTVQSR